MLASNSAMRDLQQYNAPIDSLTAVAIYGSAPQPTHCLAPCGNAIGAVGMYRICAAVCETAKTDSLVEGEGFKPSVA